MVTSTSLYCPVCVNRALQSGSDFVQTDTRSSAMTVHDWDRKKLEILCISVLNSVSSTPPSFTPHTHTHTYPLISGLALPLALMELRARSCDRCISFVAPRLQPESRPSLAITLMHECRPLLSTALAWRPYINPT